MSMDVHNITDITGGAMRMSRRHRGVIRGSCMEMEGAEKRLGVRESTSCPKSRLVILTSSRSICISDDSDGEDMVQWGNGEEARMFKRPTNMPHV